VPNVEFKDQQTAILLATFPGLIVPGIGHWYTYDYTIAGILTGLRLAGFAAGIPGIVNDDTALIWMGSIMVGFSYLFDVADAPFSVQRYNEELEQKKKSGSFLFTPDFSSGIGFRLAFQF